MELLRAYNQTEVWFHELTAPYVFIPEFDGEFALMIWANDPAVSPDIRNSICDKIARSKCFYAVCGGEFCETWHDTIDECNLATDPNYSPPDSQFMMTTWHRDESPAEVVWYLLFCTNYPDDLRGPAPAIQRFLILFVGPGESVKQDVIATLNKEFDERIAFHKTFGDDDSILFNR